MRLGLTGLTITGGEPLQQVDALNECVEALRSTPQTSDLDILVFSGYPWHIAERRAPTLWRLVDVAICGPYIQNRPGSEPLIASTNQEMVLLSERGQARFANVDETPQLQVAVDGGNLVLVGIPRPGDLAALETNLARRGITFEGVSWKR